MDHDRISCLSMISGQRFGVRPEGKPVPAFPDHARTATNLRDGRSQLFSLLKPLRPRLIAAIAALRADLRRPTANLLNKLNIRRFARRRERSFVNGCTAAITSFRKRNQRPPLTRNVFSESLLLNKNTKQVPAASRLAGFNPGCVSAEWRSAMGRTSRQSPATTGRL